MKKFILEEQTILDVLAFLETCPYRSVSGLINKVQSTVKEFAEHKVEKPVLEEVKKVESK